LDDIVCDWVWSFTNVTRLPRGIETVDGETLPLAPIVMVAALAPEPEPDGPVGVEGPPSSPPPPQAIERQDITRSRTQHWSRIIGISLRRGGIRWRGKCDAAACLVVRAHLRPKSDATPVSRLLAG
jgi:hypothetical protein